MQNVAVCVACPSTNSIAWPGNRTTLCLLLHGMAEMGTGMQRVRAEQACRMRRASGYDYLKRHAKETVQRKKQWDGTSTAAVYVAWVAARGRKNGEPRGIPPLQLPASWDKMGATVTRITARPSPVQAPPYPAAAKVRLHTTH